MSGAADFTRPERGDGMHVPVDHAKLDALMEADGLDAVLVSSKHNIQYLLGGYRYFFYNTMDAQGLSRYLPILVYVRSRAEETAYVASPMEAYEDQLGKFRMPIRNFANMTASQAAGSAVAHLKRCGGRLRRIGLEMGFMPADAFLLLRDALPETDFVDATPALERLRAIKTPAELGHLRDASDKVVASMQAVIAGHGEGTTKQQLVDALRREEQSRGLVFDYCLITMGTSVNRAPSGQAWRQGDILTLDSGANQSGYIGDLCRMAVLGEPDTELQDLLAEIDAIQHAARVPIRAGVRGGEVFVGPEAMVARSRHRPYLDFVAHGMGLVSHEAPWLTDRAPVPYAAYHAERPLEAGMVLSIETTMVHPTRGYIKLEDTVAVTAEGHEAFGDGARGWNRGRG